MNRTFIETISEATHGLFPIYLGVLVGGIFVAAIVFGFGGINDQRADEKAFIEACDTSGGTYIQGVRDNQTLCIDNDAIIATKD